MKPKKIIAHTSSGKPIYENAGNRAHKGFTGKDHHEAYTAHYILGERYRFIGQKAGYHYCQQVMHKEQYEAHGTLGEKIPTFDESVGSVKIVGD